MLPDDPPSIAHKQIADLFARVYEWLCNSEDDWMPPFQQMLQRVARELNARDWNEDCAVTDDFVIAPADGSQYFAGEEDYGDIVNSVPPDRLDLLRARGFFGPSERDWNVLPGETDWEKELKGVTDRVLSMPVSERVTYWIEQLDKTMADEECEMRSSNRDAQYPIERLLELGNDAAIPLLINQKQK